MRKPLQTLPLSLLFASLGWGYTLNPPDIKFDYATSKSDGSHSTISWTHTIGTGGSNPYLFVCVYDGTGGGTDTISSVTYNTTTNLTLLATENVRGTGTNAAPHVWLYGVANPPTGSHTVTVTASTNGPAADSVSYLNVGDVAGVTANISNTSPVNNVIGTSRAGSWLFGCTNGGSSGDTHTHLVNSGGTSTWDSNGPYTNVSTSPFLKFSFNASFEALAYITAEIRPPKPIRVVTLAQAFFASNSWNIDGPGHFYLNACDNITSVWDTTTTPWTNITGQATITCTGGTAIAIGFTGNKTGIVVLRPNPTGSVR